MSKILFLDDNDSRWRKFQSAVPSAHRSSTAEECINSLEKNKNNDIDTLFLDHDLGGESYVDSARPDCGMEVVRFLCVNISYRDSIKTIVVHSHNILASEEMVLKLKNAGYNDVKHVPFNNLVSVLQKFCYTQEL